MATSGALGMTNRARLVAQEKHTSATTSNLAWSATQRQAQHAPHASLVSQRVRGVDIGGTPRRHEGRQECDRERGSRGFRVWGGMPLTMVTSLTCFGSDGPRLTAAQRVIRHDSLERSASRAELDEVWMRQADMSKRTLRHGRVDGDQLARVAHGSGRKSIASTALNIATLAPVPHAIESTAMAVKPGLFAERRTAWRTLCHVRSSQSVLGGAAAYGVASGGADADFAFSACTRRPRSWPPSAGRSTPN